jgi:hypothetical protein
MALFKISKGLKANLPATKTSGHCWYTIDDSMFYVDYEDENGEVQRQALNAKVAESLTGATLATILNSSDIEIPTSKAVLDAIHSYVDNKTADDFGIYVQAAEPVDAVPGDIWIDTINDPSYIPPALPEITESDNGKVLMVVNGKLQLVNLNLSIDANGVVSM